MSVESQRVSERRASMAISPLGPRVNPGGRGSMNHSCSACGGGAPCPACGGNIRTSSAAYQTLDWALRMATSSSGLPAWQTIARIAQIVEDADLPLAPETAAILSLVRTEVRLAARAQPLWFAAPPNGGPPRPAGPVVTESDEDKKLNEVPAIPSGAGHNNSPGTEEVGRECCVKELLYPVPGSVAPVGKSGAEYRRTIGIGCKFKAKAVFRPKSEDPKCDCACCVFRQYKKFEFVIDGEPDDSYPSYVEDCEMLPNGKTRCYGSSRAADPKIDDPTTETPRNTYSSECVFEMEDAPAKRGPLALESTYKLTFDFLGRIHDRCHKMAVKATRRLLLYRAGKIATKHTKEDGEDVDVGVIEDSDIGATQAPGQTPKDAWRGSTGTGSGSMPGTRIPLA